MPPVTPRTTRRPASMRDAAISRSRRRPVARDRLERGQLPVLGQLLLGQLDGDDLVGGDLLEADRQRLAGHGGHLRRHDGAQAVAQLPEVRVDLAGPARRPASPGRTWSPPRPRRSSMGGFIIVSCVRAMHPPASRADPAYPGDPPTTWSRSRRPRTTAMTRRRIRPSGRPLALDDGQHLLDGLLEVVVDDDVVGQGHARWAPRPRPCGARSATLSSGSPSAHEPSLLLLPRGRQHEDQDGVRVRGP